MKLFHTQPEVNQSHIRISASEILDPFQFLITMLLGMMKRTMRTIGQGMDIIIMITTNPVILLILK